MTRQMKKPTAVAWEAPEHRGFRPVELGVRPPEAPEPQTVGMLRRLPLVGMMDHHLHRQPLCPLEGGGRAGTSQLLITPIQESPSVTSLGDCHAGSSMGFWSSGVRNRGQRRIEVCVFSISSHTALLGQQVEGNMDLHPGVLDAVEPRMGHRGLGHP
ncbi:hypothetical protein mRhiFer1_008883 [Rhinolophus ferrumequinum]|uniref:Uncharacterized protein n=1 Tax=Rhinolophus ferrumequinum TaxID=59479 RepID=A0A7J8AG85_RHIFE|nr:hypothetical protein mRhiFer1_008883 [Rhinolophus ferrumequinum]